jgi:hypothetical protein
MQAQTVTLIVAAVGIAGTLGGTAIGQRMARSWQREQWLLDCRKEEFRELITVISDTLAATLEAVSGKIPSRTNPDELGELYSKSLRAMNDRIFIAKDIKRLGVRTEWLELTTGYAKDSDTIQFIARIDKLLVALVEVATKPPEQ